MTKPSGLPSLLRDLPGYGGAKEDTFDFEMLMCLGLLWCQGSDEAKAKVLLQLANPPD